MTSEEGFSVTSHRVTAIKNFSNFVLSFSC